MIRKSIENMPRILDLLSEIDFLYLAIYLQKTEFKDQADMCYELNILIQEIKNDRSST